MNREYGNISLYDYLKSMPESLCTGIAEVEIHNKVCRYLQNLIRYNTNMRIVEALII